MAATATVPSVMSNGATRMRDLILSRSLATRRGTPCPSPCLACSDFSSTLDIAPPSTRGNKYDGREDDYVEREIEQRRVPDVVQQTETVRYPAQRDQDKPRCRHHQ